MSVQELNKSQHVCLFVCVIGERDSIIEFSSDVTPLSVSQSQSHTVLCHYKVMIITMKD